MLCMTQLTTTRDKQTQNTPAQLTTPAVPGRLLLVWSPGLAQRVASPVSRLIKEWELMSTRIHELGIVNSWSLPGGRVTHLNEVLVRAGFNTARDPAYPLHHHPLSRLVLPQWPWYYKRRRQNGTTHQ